MITDILQGVFTLVMVIGILFFSWWATRKIAQGAQGSMQSKYMKLVDKIPLFQDKSIVLVQVGNEYYLLGVASDNINMLAKFDKDTVTQLSKEDIQPVSPINFEDILKKMGGKGKNGR